ncbi:hypothetical protein COCCADRAFT_10656 [Bipolaris zeicola 26-R-13]|uniref:Uncharacterized protein n=1 Tax=Cochliobolus carbonum (strain 26-R-13) TaxID=930089 RepID=W6Y5M4_COCC2|nr:uncharacterized protein COCCADRAFT_10656 [Bipolaris zeicola 26-R-13]EUC26596.1 hypothetical protein COCCADRAFT_10656 [Bipolaris zeicola 26-R-13]
MWRVTACETLPDYCAARKFQPDPNLNFVVETIGLCVCAATELQDMALSRVVGTSYANDGDRLTAHSRSMMR